MAINADTAKCTIQLEVSMTQGQTGSQPAEKPRNSS